jgi:eukaryotic-like serine/threonine-protein kinase
VGYMSPEQVRGKPADHRSDIFAFGAVLYEMLTGKRTFQKPTSAETMAAIMNEEPPPITQTGPAVSPALQRVLQRCLEKNPEQRFQSASDLAFALEALSDSGSAATAAVAPAQLHTSWKALVAAGIAIAIVAAFAAWLLRPPAVPVVESATQLTNDGAAKLGGLQTDGTRVYFDEGVTGSQKIAQISVEGGQTAQVATNLLSPIINGITADGSALLVSAGPAFQNPLWLLPLPAGEARRLGDIQPNDAGLFPDDRVIYTLGTAVYSAAKDGSDPHKLAEARPHNLFRPRVSPDGKQTVFSTNDAFAKWGSIYQANADGTGLREILHAGAGDLPPQLCCARWTPDGSYLLFLGEREGRWDLWALPVGSHFWHRTAAPVRLSNGPFSYDDFVPGRESRKLFAIGTLRRGELVRYDPSSRQFISYLGGISAFAPTFSRDGKWMAYMSYPEHTLWRSRSDGSDRLQLTYPPMEATFSEISPDGSQVAFNTPDGTTYVVSMNGGSPRRFAENAWAAAWSPDSTLLALILPVPGKAYGEKGFFAVGIANLRDGKVSAAPGSQGLLGPWFVTQDTVVAANEDANKFLLLNIKTGKVSELTASPDGFPSWAVSPDFKYLYYSTGGSNPQALRLRFADHAVETITSLKNLRLVNDQYIGVQLNPAPDGSLLTTRDIGTQEIYALTVKWP